MSEIDHTELSNSEYASATGRGGLGVGLFDRLIVCGVKLNPCLYAGQKSILPHSDPKVLRLSSRVLLLKLTLVLEHCHLFGK